MRLPLKKYKHLTVFSFYAPTLMADSAARNNFHSNLRRYLNKTPANDKVLQHGDFTARVVRDIVARKGVLGRHGVGNCHDNGRLLLEFFTEFKLAITNTIFQQKDRLKTTWMHPLSKHWHLLHHVLVRQRDQKEFLLTRAMSCAEC